MHRHRRRWSDSELEFLKANRKGHTRAWIAEQLGRKPESIKKKITEIQALKYKTRVYNRRAVDVPRGQKLCRACGRILLVEEFHRQTRAKDGHQSKCKRCSIELAIQWNRDHPEAFSRNARTYKLRKMYGLERVDFDALLAKQKGRCPVCDLPLAAQIHVDHDHSTGAVRGLLHIRCNAGLGALGDSPVTLKRAIAYLEKEGN